jgi:steroid 5-alpha reductase family enzyme
VPDSPYRIGRSLAGLSRPRAFGVVALAYAAAAIAAAAVVASLRSQHPVTAYFVADIVATIVVFAFSMAVANSSLYDPYWSVAPPLILAGWLAGHATFTVRQAVVLLLVVVWGARLTANWAVGWRGLGQEDWRYRQIREQTRGRLPWWLVSFLGIQLMPTLVVFAGMLSAWAVVVGTRSLNAIDLLALLVTVTAIALETVADLQLRRFAGDPAGRGRTVDIGLWRRSRHPNYLGEIGLWWGLWLFGLAAAPDWWWTVAGPLIMVALFVGVSVPLMEKRSLERRADYGEYQRNVPMLLPWKRTPKKRIRHG